MQGICFIDPFFHLIIKGKKTQIRRLVSSSGKPKYKKDETVYLKEPYLATINLFPCENRVIYKFEYDNPPNYYWENKLFMPQKYARCFIKITDVRTEQLQNISAEDCVREGIEEFEGFYFCPSGCFITPDYGNILTPQTAYAALINKINGKRTWERNPLVYVYDFVLKALS
jgi:hypothetical protein